MKRKGPRKPKIKNTNTVVSRPLGSYFDEVAVFDEVTQRRFEKLNPLHINNYRAKSVHQGLLGAGEYLDTLSLLRLAEHKNNAYFDVETPRGIFCSMGCAREYHSRSAYQYEMALECKPIRTIKCMLNIADSVDIEYWSAEKHGSFCQECDGFLNGWFALHGDSNVHGVTYQKEINLTPLKGYFWQE